MSENYLDLYGQALTQALEEKTDFVWMLTILIKVLTIYWIFCSQRLIYFVQNNIILLLFLQLLHWKKKQN